MKHIKYVVSVLCAVVVLFQCCFAVSDIDKIAGGLNFSDLSSEDIKHITKDLTLPLVIGGADVVWSSSDENVIEIDGGKGIVRRPPFGEGFASVFLKAQFVTDKEFKEKIFLVRVCEESIGYSYSDEISDAADKFEKDFLGGFNPLKTTGDIKIPAVSKNMTLTVNTDNSAVLSSGKVIRSFDNDIAATMYFCISNGYERLKLSYPVIIKAYDTDDAKKLIDEDFEWLREYMQKLNLSKVTQNLTLPKTAPNGTSLEWVSNSQAVTNEGVVTRGDENTVARLTVKGTLEKMQKEASFDAAVYKKAPDDKNNTGGMTDSSSSGSSRSSSGGGGTVIPVIPSGNTGGETEIFSDLSKSHWVYEAAKFLSEKKIMTGYEKNFRPDDSLLREECVKIIVTAFGYTDETGNEISFGDVDENSWAYEYIRTAYNKKIVRGMSETLFGAGERITREDFAVMIYNAVPEKQNTGETEKFADYENVADYAAAAVEYLKAAGVVKGRENNMFFPKESITRAEAAQIIFNILTK